MSRVFKASLTNSKFPNLTWLFYDPRPQSYQKVGFTVSELLMTKSISYSWSSIGKFHKFIAKQVEQRRITWQGIKDIQDQAATFFRHWDLCNLARNEAIHATTFGPLHSSITPKSTNTNKACRIWNYTAFANVTNRIQKFVKIITAAEFANWITQCFLVRNTVLQFPLCLNDIYLTIITRHILSLSSRTGLAI